MTFDRAKYEQDRLKNAESMMQDNKLQDLGIDFVRQVDRYGYGYQWTWLDLPIVQMSEDVMAAQEIIWKTKPDLIIETGVAWGGSIVLSASILQLIGKGKVVGVDITIPQKNNDAIMKYPFSKERIELIEGSSIADDVVAKVKSKIKPGDKVMLILDSNHTHDHVLAELEAYAPLVTKDFYIIVSDTVIEAISPQPHRPPRPWGKGNNAKTAVDAFLAKHKDYVADNYYNARALASFTKHGYLRRIK